jgi:SAM-dependent methyltransferase
VSEPSVYAAPTAHGSISELIRRHSANPEDVRDVALEGVNVAAADRLLDLGCGFGFMAEGLARRAPAGTEIVGVDVNPSNEIPFVRTVGRAGCRGRFVCERLVDRLDPVAGRFSGAAASYSLYFFPGLVRSISRILRPEGFFVAVTHREASLRHLLDVLDLPADNAPHLAVLHRFSAETGAGLLTPWFGSVETREYPNDLVFERADFEALLAYVRFKLPLIVRGFPLGMDVPRPIAGRAAVHLEREGRIEIAKDDRVFVCREPR